MVSAPPLILNKILYNLTPLSCAAGNVARLVSIATDLIEELIAMERMRVGADETSISDPDPEFDPDDPEYMRSPTRAASPCRSSELPPVRQGIPSRKRAMCQA